VDGQASNGIKSNIKEIMFEGVVGFVAQGRVRWWARVKYRVVFDWLGAC
jgi:hypothetical protein